MNCQQLEIDNEISPMEDNFCSLDMEVTAIESDIEEDLANDEENLNENEKRNRGRPLGSKSCPKKSRCYQT